MKRHAEAMNSALAALVARSGELLEAEAAAMVGMSLRRFRAVFPQMFGETFRLMRHQIRMDCARRALEETNRSIPDISESLGYSKRSKLERSFKKMFGVTPVQYRKKQKFSKMASQGVDTPNEIV